jgi:heparosan-N-sulfate-glucuronate 5-epimerase
MNYRWLRAAALVILFSLAISAALVFSTEPQLAKLNSHKWPALELKDEYKAAVKEAKEKYKAQNVDYKPKIKDYKPFDDYLNYGSNGFDRYTNNARIKLDDSGMPLVKYDNGFHYNPVTIAQYALTSYGAYLKGEMPQDQFLKATDKLVEMAGTSGALRYDFEWYYYLTQENFQPGWVSGLAQGQALSVLARAYKLTGNKKYLEAGNRVFEFMITPIAQGGTLGSLESLDPSLKDYITFEEYIVQPASYTINGFMFALLGLYDWWQVSPQALSTSHYLAKQYFDQGLDTLERILPYFDIGGFTTYDLGHLIYKKPPHTAVGYHAAHIYLLHALYSITNRPWLKYCENVWASYVD